mgnify:CR=1 FL=1|tara:strand:+ start:2139 stop:3743 length:1605 start_codon:yes stop_codon:yes gene_type:complete
MNEKLVVVVADKIATSGLNVLMEDDRFEIVMANEWDTPKLHKAMPKAHGLIVRSATQVTRDLLEASPNLRIVGRAGVGVDNIDLMAASEFGIPVINAPEGNTVSAAELTFALILAVARKISWADGSVRNNEWSRSYFAGIELRGKVLSLIGAGRIGVEVSHRAKAFGMRVIAHDPYLSKERSHVLGVEKVELADALTQGDVVSLHVPLTPTTENMIGWEELLSMKPTAILVNASRGGVVDESALVKALETGEIAGAALDVFINEPLPEDDPLRGASNLILTPHLGASTAEAQELVATEIAEGVRTALIDGDFSGALNIPTFGTTDPNVIGPLLDLARKVGQTAAVLGYGSMRRVDIGVSNDKEDIFVPISAAVITGMLTPVVGKRNINYVNALHLANARNIAIGTELLDEHPDYSEFLRVALDTEGGRVSVCGALLRDRLRPCIVQIDDFIMKVSPKGCLVILRNKDVPGVIGKVGTSLGTQGLNIAEYMQARNTAGGQAMAVISVDGRVTSEALASLREDNDILDVRSVFFGK